MIPAAQGPTSQRVDRVVSVLAPLLGVNRATSGELRRVMLTHQFTTLPKLQTHLGGPGHGVSREPAQPRRSTALALLGDPNIVKRQRYWAQVALQRQQRDANGIPVRWGRPPVQW